MEKLYDKLVRDNIPDTIRLNGEEPITRILTNEEYWEYLLMKDSEELADKLELIIAMAKFNDFTLEEIIEVAYKERQKNGAFEKSLLLEKVLK